MNRSGIAWIEEYRNHPRLEYSGETARGFAKALNAEGFERKNDEVVNDLFLGQEPEVETAHIFYFSGHGSERGPLMSKGPSRASYDTMDLGTGHLTYAVFDCCKMLDPFFQGRWQKAFEGLRYLLGFARSVGQNETRGQRFAEHLSRGISISEAWRMAAQETGGQPWACLRAVTKGAVVEEEYWSNNLTLPGDPGPPLRFLHCYESEEMVVPGPTPVRAERVPLFRTPPQVWTAERKQILAQALGVPEAEPISGDGWSELRLGSTRVELYDANGSFWLRRDPSPRVELFRQPEPPPPFAASIALQRARADLSQMKLLERVSLHSVSSTVEQHHELESLGGQLHRSNYLITARHVSHSFNVGGLPVFGPGAKLRLSYRGEEASELLFFWREPAPIDGGEEVPVIPEAEAWKILRESDGFRHLPDRSLDISEGRLGYYALPPREEQDYLLPVYEFTGTSFSDEFRYDFTRYVQAVPEVNRPDSSVFRKPTVFS